MTQDAPLDQKALEVLVEAYVDARIVARDSNVDTYMGAAKRVDAARAALRSALSRRVPASGELEEIAKALTTRAHFLELADNEDWREEVIPTVSVMRQIADELRALAASPAPEGKTEPVAWVDPRDLIKTGPYTTAIMASTSTEGVGDEAKPVAWRVKRYGEIAGGVMAWSEWMLFQNVDLAGPWTNPDNIKIEPLFTTPPASKVTT